MNKPILSILLVLFVFQINAQVQRALIIGINQYAPPLDYRPPRPDPRTYSNLDGAVDDALAIKSILISKFNFSKTNIKTLLDTSATRYAILSQIAQLLDNSKEGDIAFIYFAGHGSQVRNSKSFEIDKLDQTIVPADAWKYGVKDIRDKEMSRLINLFLDKKIMLTLIFDCCHSASMSRGPNINERKTRYMPDLNWDSQDSSRPVIPESRPEGKFLYMAAAQSNQLAQEYEYQTDVIHGAFTGALIQAFNQLPSNASALDIFSSARAIIKGIGYIQEPLISGTIDRQMKSLFGSKLTNIDNSVNIPVSLIGEENVQLEGGSALGLRKGNILASIKTNKDTAFKIRIDDITGVATSIGKVIYGDIKKLNGGDNFKVVNWISSDEPLLKVYIPKTSISDAEIKRLTSLAASLKKSGKFKWIENLNTSKVSPYATIFWENDQCFIKIDTSKAKVLNDISEAAILKYCKRDSSLYMELPASKKMSNAIYNKITANHNLQLVDNPAAAQFVLFSILGINDRPAYGLRKSMVNLNDTLEVMPLQTDGIQISSPFAIVQNDISQTIADMAYKLARMEGWLMMSSPEEYKNYPYHLEMFSETENKIISDGHYKLGDKLTLNLISYDENLNIIEPRYVYVFGMDHNGKMQLLYPAGNIGSSENQFPRPAGMDPIRKIKIFSNITATLPTGTDIYFMLATEKSIPNADRVFNMDGVISNVQSRGSVDDVNPLADLIYLSYQNTRGNPPSTPSTWTLEKKMFRCTY